MISEIIFLKKMFTYNKDKQFIIKQSQILSLPQRRFYLPRFYVTASLCAALSSRTQQQWWWGWRHSPAWSAHFSCARPCVHCSAPWGEKKSEDGQAWDTRIFLHLSSLWFFFSISFSSLPDTSRRTSSDLLLEVEKVQGHVKQGRMALHEPSYLWQSLLEVSNSDLAAAQRCTSEPGWDGRAAQQNTALAAQQNAALAADPCNAVLGIFSIFFHFRAIKPWGGSLSSKSSQVHRAQDKILFIGTQLSSTENLWRQTQ